MVDPQSDNRGMLVVYNPLKHEVSKTIRVDCYYTGLTDSIEVRPQDTNPTRLPLNARQQAHITVSVPAEGMSWFVIRK